MERRLSAIMAADVAGYSRLVATDEEGTVGELARRHREVVVPAIRALGGRIVSTAGDGFLAEFGDTVSAVRAALHIQSAVADCNEKLQSHERLELRIGVHTADIIVAADDIVGDGVNIAARLERLAEPGGVYVSARVQDEAADQLDVGFEDLGEQQLKNIPRPLRVYRVVTDADAGSRGRPDLARPNRPSIAVLPFRNISGDPEQEYFADGLTDDLIIALSRWRWFFVIARDTSFAFKDQTDLRRVGEDLGVRYLLEGSVRKSGARMRVTVQLTDVRSGSMVWGEAFDRELTDILKLQDEIVDQVVAAIEPTMRRREGERVSAKHLKDYSAFDCFQRGMWHHNKISREGYHEAIPYFRDAIRRDPDLALGHIGLARILYGGAIFGWSDQPQEDVEEALAEAEIAIRLDPRDALAYYAYSGAALYVNRHEDALEAARNAVALNPNCALGQMRLGEVLVFLGRPAEALPVMERAIRRSPYDPLLKGMLGTRALAHYQLKDYALAEIEARAAYSRGHQVSLQLLAAALGRLGRGEEIDRLIPRDLLRQLILERPPMVNFTHEEDLRHLLEGLEMAGVRLLDAARLAGRISD